VNEDPTKELPGATPFEQRVLAEFASLRGEVAEIDSVLVWFSGFSISDKNDPQITRN
jgi:hypothetical protein